MRSKYEKNIHLIIPYENKYKIIVNLSTNIQIYKNDNAYRLSGIYASTTRLMQHLKIYQCNSPEKRKYIITLIEAEKNVVKFNICT